MKIIAKTKTHRLVHVNRSIGCIVPEDWRLQEWDGESWLRRSRMYFNPDEAYQAARRVGLEVPDNP